MKLSQLVSFALSRTWHELTNRSGLLEPPTRDQPTLRRRTETKGGVTYVGIPNKIARRMGR